MLKTEKSKMGLKEQSNEIFKGRPSNLRFNGAGEVVRQSYRAYKEK
jgi:hypothetical protein